MDGVIYNHLGDITRASMGRDKKPYASRNALADYNMYSLSPPDAVDIPPDLQGFGELGGIPRRNGLSTELGITVTNPDLNQGRATNIPSLVEGQRDVWQLSQGMRLTPEQENIAVRRAIERSQGPLGM